MTTLDPEQLREAGFGQEWRVCWTYKDGGRESSSWLISQDYCRYLMHSQEARDRVQDVWIEMHWVSTPVTEEGVLS